MHAANSSYWPADDIFGKLDAMELLGVCWLLTRSRARLRTLRQASGSLGLVQAGIYADILSLETTAFMALATKLNALGCQGKFLMGTSTRSEWRKDLEDRYTS